MVIKINMISIIILLTVNSVTSNHIISKPVSKYIDIYTNYPKIDEIIQNHNYSRQETQPAYIKLQTTKYIDPDTSQFDRSDLDITEHHITDDITSKTNIQKISRSLSTSPNSKQLEKNENFFTKINNVIKNQFSRLFKYPLSKTAEDLRVPPNQQRIEENLAAKKRFLNIFTILQFENSRCEAQGGSTSYEGTCYHRLECAERGGVSMGACAKGYGVCCIFRFTCDGYSNQNTSYFECNPDSIPSTTVTPPTGIPTIAPPIDPRQNFTLLNRFKQWGKQDTGGGTCIFTVDKRVSDVRQLRIDFLDLDLRGPTNGNCITDRLVISGGNINMRIPVICGYNSGQHVYVDVSDATGPIQLSVYVANPTEKRFRIKISQLRAPCANFMNCLQYYTGISGIIQTFNYDSSPRGFNIPPQYYNNLNYAICIKKESGYCSITYSNEQNGVVYPFMFSNMDANGNIIPPGQAGVEIFNCPDDYVVINGIRLCGDRLNDGSINPDFTMNAPVTDFSGGPFILPVRTDAQNVDRGFKLFYRQNLCSDT